MSAFQPGDMLAGHEIVRLIGTGGHAEVYEVIDPAGARRALKVIGVPHDVGAKIQQRLVQEGEALAMIEHINVVRLVAAGVEGSRVWLRLEYVDGKNLREACRLHGGRPPIESVLRWIRQACEGLAAAHSIGAVHRDIKPENILVTQGDVVKVIDFGIVKFRGWGVKTTHEQQLGTALYGAPEQLKPGAAPDPRADVYAMGIVLFEALTGRHPIVDGPTNMMTVCQRQLTHVPPPLRTILPDAPEELETLLAAAIAKDPAARIVSMAAFADGLQMVLGRLLVSHRAAARNIAVPRQDPRLLPTAPMPAVDDPASKPPSSLVGPPSADPTSEALKINPTVKIARGGPVSSPSWRAALDADAGNRAPVIPPDTLRSPREGFHALPPPPAFAAGGLTFDGRASAASGPPVVVTSRLSRPPRRAWTIAAVVAALAAAVAAVAWFTLGLSPTPVRSPAATSPVPPTWASASPPAPSADTRRRR